MSKLYCQVYGQGSPLVLLHGWGMSGAIWQPLLPVLGQTRMLYVVDLPGFGCSQQTSPTACLESLTQAILAVVPEKADWLGWSLGGLIASAIATRAPDRVNCLVQVASSPCFVQTRHWPGLLLSVLEKFGQSLVQDYAATLQRFFALQVLGLSAPQALLVTMKQLLSLSPQPSPQALQVGLELLIKTDLRAAFAQLQCPLLAILGSQDVLVPKAIAPRLLALNPNCRVEVMPGAAHTPFLSHMTPFTGHVNQFLNRFPAT